MTEGRQQHEQPECLCRVRRCRTRPQFRRRIATARSAPGDRIRIDLRRKEANMLVSDEELDACGKALAEAGGSPMPESQTPWRELQRATTTQTDTAGAVLKDAPKYQRLAQ
jgi:hypothetical protein